MFLARLLIVACISCALKGQSGDTLSVTPSSVQAGAPAFSLSVALADSAATTPASTWAVRWNGSVRPTTLSTNSYSSGQLTATINASDVAQPGFAEITVIDQATGVVYPPVAWFFVTANVYASDVAYDSVRNRFYVTVPSGSSRPNAPAESVVAVDAATGNIIASVNAGSMPSLLAISDDASYLYVYLSESSAISRVALDTFNPDIQIPLLPNASLLWMQVLPGSPKSLATAQANLATSATQGLVVYDDATARPNTYPGAPGRFLFTDPATIVGGYGTGVVEAWTVTAWGIGSSPQMLAAQSDPVAYGDGWLLGQNGSLTDLSGARASQQIDLSGVGAFVPGLNRLLMLGSTVNGSSGLQLGAFEDTTITALGRIVAPLSDIEYPTPTNRLLVWGNDGVAFVYSQQLFIGHTELAAAPPTISAASIANAATLESGDISPGEILSIFGSNLGPSQGRTLEFSEPRQVSTDLGDSQVWFDGLPGIMLYAGSGQLNVVAPFGLGATNSTLVQVWYQGIPSAIVPLHVAPASPGIFTQNGSGQGAGAILNADGTLNTPSDPAPAGSAVSLYATGGGETQPALADGQQDVYAWPLAAGAQVLLNGSSVPVLYSGSAPGLVAGMIQVNFQIPSGFPPSSSAQVQLSIGGVVSPTGITISTR